MTNYKEWDQIRNFVWSRDGGQCAVCMKKISKRGYDCSHVIDRIAGGSDDPENLVIMCSEVNRYRKPITETLSDYESWLGEIRASMLFRPCLLTGYIQYDESLDEEYEKLAARFLESEQGKDFREYWESEHAGIKLTSKGIVFMMKDYIEHGSQGPK